MNFVNAICPICRKNIQVNADSSTCFCEICGGMIEVKSAIDLATPKKQPVQTAPIQTKEEQINNYLVRAGQFVSSGRFDEAESYYNRVLDLDPYNSQAKAGIIKTNSIITSNNLHIQRTNRRPVGEAKIVLLINNERRKVDLDNPCDLKLPVGTYQIKFMRGILTSTAVTINIKDRKTRYNISFTPKTFTIEVKYSQYA